MGAATTRGPFWVQAGSQSYGPYETKVEAEEARNLNHPQGFVSTHNVNDIQGARR